MHRYLVSIHRINHKDMEAEKGGDEFSHCINTKVREALTSPAELPYIRPSWGP